jgi:hypothetical protein
LAKRRSRPIRWRQSPDFYIDAPIFAKTKTQRRTVLNQEIC